MRAKEATEALGALLKQTHPTSFTEEFERLQILAEYKYDEYQQFVPGRLFVDSLTQWLQHIEDPAQRQAAYDFVLRRLVFISRADVFHFTKMAHRHLVRPHLIREETRRLGLSASRVIHLSRSTYLKSVERACLVLGLSDGARIDDFRRLAGLSNEQVHSNYQLPTGKASEMREELKNALAEHDSKIRAEAIGTPLPPRFRYVVLVDDFTGSSTSFFTKKEQGWGGKLGRFLHQLPGLGPDFLDPDWQLIVLHYAATSFAEAKIREKLDDYNASQAQGQKPPLKYSLLTVQRLKDQDVRRDGEDAAYRELIDHYDVVGTYDAAMAKGGPDGHQRWGFAGCALPVVLYHNTPNNSIAPLWVYDGLIQPGLFPRVRRHLDEG